MATSVNLHDELAIKNVIARYCEALDGKLFDLLDKVFAADVEASYPFNTNMKGVDTIKNAITNRLGPIRTHHSLTTQSIIFGADPKVANAVTYFIGVHFGQGPHEGKELKAYGRYVDEFVLLEAKEGNYEGVPGASGIWRISRRAVDFTARIGDEVIMKEF